MISILTSTIGRELYLSRLLDSMASLGATDKVDFEWHIVFQREAASDKMQEKIKALPFASKVKTLFSPEVKFINSLIEDFKTQARFPLYLKLDDDALICSPDFLQRYVELSKLVPDAVLFPLEIGGYTNTQASLDKHQIVYGEESNVYYTVSHSVLPSALAVMCPMNFIKKFTFPPGQFDAPFLFIQCNLFRYPAYQLQNGLIVEHQEGAYGQHYRQQLTDGQKW